MSRLVRKVPLALSGKRAEMLLNILQYPGRPATENDPAQMPTVPMGRIPALDLDTTGYFQDLVIPTGPHLPSRKITRQTHEHPGADTSESP